MVNLIQLTYGTGVTFFLNPERIETIEWDAARNQTQIITSNGAVLHCFEDPDAIQALINAAGAPPPVTPTNESVSGVGGRGPIHGDGSPMESRKENTWNPNMGGEPVQYDPFTFGMTRR